MCYRQGCGSATFKCSFFSRHCGSGSSLFTFIRIRILILLLIKVMKFYDYGHWCTDPLWLHFESPRIRCEHSRPLTVRPHFEPLKLLNFYFHVHPDLAFHSNAVLDSDSALQNNADRYPQPWFKRTWISDQCCYSCQDFSARPAKR
jgi:hypothetical protein